MKLAVVGSRTFNNYAFLEETLDHLGKIDLIISGGAEGADTLAEQYAINRKIPTKIHWPDWEKYGKAAGPIRNADIIRDCDEVVAFWDGHSRGTQSSVKLAGEMGKPVCIVWKE